MGITIRDLMQQELFEKLSLVAGEGGVDRPVSKVGILDYEFSERGNRLNPAGHWEPGELVLTTMAHVRAGGPDLLSTVKRLRAEGTCGVAIKNIYALDIPPEVRRFANQSRYPVFVFTDNSLYFENVIIGVHDYSRMVDDWAVREEKVQRLMDGDHDGRDAATPAREICPGIGPRYVAAYLAPRSLAAPWPTTPVAAGRRGTALVRYGDGFFFVYSFAEVRPPDRMEAVRQLAELFSLKDYYVGVSEVHNFLSGFKIALEQSYYSSIFGRITRKEVSRYEELGLYQLLMPYWDTPACQAYYDRVIGPIIECDTKTNAGLLDTLLAYEACHGNIRRMTDRLHIHGNTIRYRIKKAAEAANMADDIEEFIGQLGIVVKLHRIQMALGPDADGGEPDDRRR